MKTRHFGRTGWEVSEIGFGSWAIGADWGRVDDRDAIAALNEALDRGMTFVDTADVYGNGRAEKLIAQVLKSRRSREPVVVATKAGRRLNPHVAAGYNRENLAAFVERSLQFLEVDALDLVLSTSRHRQNKRNQRNSLPWANTGKRRNGLVLRG